MPLLLFVSRPTVDYKYRSLLWFLSDIGLTT